MRHLGLALVLLVLGPGWFSFSAFSLWRGWWREGVPLAEVLVDRAVGAEPPPRTAWDRRLALLHTLVGIIGGMVFTACLLAVLYSFF